MVGFAEPVRGCAASITREGRELGPLATSSALGDELTGLDASVADAVTQGLRSAKELEEELAALFSLLSENADKLRAQEVGAAGAEIIERYTAHCAALRKEALARCKRQKKRLATFNLVLFGRTGAGKSSLIEALSSGHGKPISQGESDWTTKVRDVRWRGCRLVDTPGIAGWGRTLSREELETRARLAVEDADVVLLCFDTQSQQAGEFSRVAEWIEQYHKPCIAVLNCRNARWRFPVRVTSGEARRRLSRSVAEHAGNVRDELGKIGLDDIPVVAVNAKRAAFARTRDPYAGPDALTRSKLRTEVGPDRLLEWSNLDAIETLLSSALREHAEPLRLGMLREQTRGILARAHEALGVSVEADAQLLAEQLERGITQVLELLGLPTIAPLASAVSELEELRNGRFDVRKRGSFEVHARNRLKAALRDPRRNAQRRGERMIDRSFAERHDLSGRDFLREVIDPATPEVEQAVADLSGELQDYLDERIQVLIKDVQADLDAVAEGSSVSGGAGKSDRAVGVSLEVGSGVTGIVGGVLLVGAAANWWNPFGWTTFAALAVGGIVSSVLGGKFRKRAAVKREAARTSARAEIRRNINRAFDEVEERAAAAIALRVQEALNEKLKEELDRAIALRRMAATGRDAAEAVSAALKDLGPPTQTTGLLVDVARAVERESFPGQPAAARLLWLGETWCDDPDGLEQPETRVSEPSIPGEHGEHPIRPRPARIPAASGGRPSPGTGRRWLEASGQKLAGDAEAQRALASVRAILTRDRPTLAVAGDYSSGKSTLIKRLLLDAGKRVPKSLTIDAAPKTSSARRYRWGRWDLLDTPGFQSTHLEHAGMAHEALWQASALVVLFNPNLVVGNPHDLELLLVGDNTLGRVGMLRRTLFVINRADDLGVDPHDDRAAFEKLCQRKQLELAQAIAALPAVAAGGLTVEADQIICTASDPFGLVGDRSDARAGEYDAYRDWDGMDAFRTAFDGSDLALGENAIDVSILHAGAANLGALVSRRAMQLRTLQSKARALSRLALDLEAAIASGQAILHSAQDRLLGVVAARVSELFDETLASADAKTRRARALALEKWGSDPLLQQQISEWISRVESELREWQTEVADRVDRRLDSAAFVLAFPKLDEVLDVSLLKPKSERRGKDAAAQGARGAAGKLEGASRETVIKAGHRIGYKFQPWEATKVTSRLNAAGGAVGVVFGAVEIAGVARSLRREKEADEGLIAERRRVLESVSTTTHKFFEHADGEQQAPRDVILEAIAVVEGVRESVGNDRQRLESEAKALRRANKACRSAVERAMELSE